MSAYRAALLALLVVGASVAALPAGATGDAGDAASPAEDAVGATGDAVGAEAASATGDAAASGPALDAQSTVENGSANDSAENGSANNSSFGADISSFMQSSTAEVGGAVETGMWTAAYNGTDNRSVRARLVERQTTDLREELADLRERRQELFAEREAGNVSEAAYKARVGEIVGQINALNAAINATETRAREVNANVENVTRLRTETAELSGPEISAVARNLTGVGNGEGGPPTGVGNGNGVGDGNGTSVGTGDGNGDGNGVGDGNGAGDGSGNDVGNGNNDGNGDGVGNGDGDENGAGGNANDVADGANETTTTVGGASENVPAKLSTIATGTGDFTGSVSVALGARW